ncbi:MAG TPA: ABC transporter permease [Ktedonobacteraceae bacterium]|nr:ABC transporter permease [Ktedonobacteraceae bacterium]
MNFVEPAMPEPRTSRPARSSSVMMGRQDFLSTVLRLTSTELYKIRRRAMSKVMGIIALATILFTYLFAPFISQDLVHLPLSVTVAVEVPRLLGIVLTIVLVGTIVGGEYGIGTIRLMLTRGPSRIQFLLGKIGAALACIMLGLLFMFLAGILLGQAVSLFINVPTNWHFFSLDWLGRVLLYLLSAMFGLCIYAMMALFLAILGRSSTAGVAGAMTWSLLEPVFGLLVSTVGERIHGPLGAFFVSIPDYLISNNVGVLLQNESIFLTHDQPATLSNLHALLVLALYLLVFFGLSWWLLERRDITN